MLPLVTIVYNEPLPSGYDQVDEAKAVLGVLDEVEAVRRSLLERGYPVVLLPLVPPFEDAAALLQGIGQGVVFNLFEGFCGCPETEALVPEYLEKLGLPFTGCAAGALRLGLDKALAKQRLQTEGVATPGFQVLCPDTLRSFQMEFPCIVKPAGEDASHGITAASVVHDLASLERQVTHVCSVYGCGALVERFLEGREFNATVIGYEDPLVLPPSEINYSLPPGQPKLLTFASKWEPESPEYLGTGVTCPAAVSPVEYSDIINTARKAFVKLGFAGYARVDMRMDSAGRVNVIEVNPDPDISPEAGAARQAAAHGWDYPEFIERIIRLAMEKRNNGCQDSSHDGSGQACHHEHSQAYA